MAVPPPANEAFLREVDEELRRDQAVQLWRRYGRMGLIGVGAGLAAFAAWLGFQEWQLTSAGAQGTKLSAALDKVRTGDRTGETAIAQLARDGAPGYRATAKFVQADLALQKNDLAGAARIFGEVAADTGLAQPFRDLALIRQTLAEYDTLKPEQVLGRLKPYAAKDNMWFGAAGEMVAIAYIRQGNMVAARKLLADLAEAKDVPETVRNRVVALAGSAGVDTIKQDGKQGSNAQKEGGQPS